jgi:hypothetical protein
VLVAPAPTAPSRNGDGRQQLRPRRLRRGLRRERDGHSRGKKKISVRIGRGWREKQECGSNFSFAKLIMRNCWR